MTEEQLLKYIRDHKGMAARIEREYGISQSQISRWVNGKRRMLLESELTLHDIVTDIIRKDVTDIIRKGAKQ